MPRLRLKQICGTGPLPQLEVTVGGDDTRLLALEMKSSAVLPLAAPPQESLPGAREAPPSPADRKQSYTDEHAVQACFATVKEFLRLQIGPSPCAASTDNLYAELDNLRRRKLIARLDRLGEA